MKKILTKLLLLFSIFFLTPGKSVATHVIGSDIYYTSDTAGIYNVYIDMYRDCRGVAMSPISMTVSSSAGTVVVAMTRYSIEKVTVACDTADACDSVNTMGTGLGYEIHRFKGRVDFNTAPFNSSAWQSACEVTFAFGQCCRTGDITTGQANANYYNEAMLNKCLAPGNSSPVLFNPPKWTYCLSQPSYTSFAGRDTADGDSISYSFGVPLEAHNDSIPYGTSNLCAKPFTAQNPITPFVLNPCGPWTPKPNLDPPQGNHLNPATGEWSVTPNEAGELGIVVVVLTEWRKDNNGVYQVIGRTRRDHQALVINCYNNNAPEIEGPFEYTVKAGEQICFDVKSKDNVVIPPPPALPPSPDTLTMTYNHLMDGATFNVDNKREKTGTFCWTPSCNDARVEPYAFSVTVKDNSCPVTAMQSRTFYVKVDGQGFFGDSITAICDSAARLIKPDGVTSGPYLWSTGDTTSSITTDSAGVYWLKALNECGDTVTDYIELYHSYYPVVNLGPDTVLCGNAVHVLNAGNPGASYSWSNGRTSRAIPIHNTGLYWVDVTTGCGVVRDSIFVAGIDTNSFNVDLGPDTTICSYDNAFLNAGVYDAAYIWSTGNNDSAILQIDSSGLYWVNVFVCGLTFTDSVQYTFVDPPMVDLGADVYDTSFNDTLDAGNPGATYLWNTSDTTQTIVVTQTGRYIVTVTNICGTDTDTVDFYTLGVDDIDAISSKIILFPNPSNGVFTISFEDLKVTDFKLEILSTDGRKVYAKNVHASKGTNHNELVDISHLPKGVYYINITTDSDSYRMKIILK